MTQKQIEQRRAAARSLVAQRGTGYMAEIGKRGYQAAIAKHPDLNSKAGWASWRAQNKAAIQRGDFSNQTLEMWGF